MSVSSPDPGNPRKVLVFGPQCGPSGRIARQLAQAGFEPVVPGLTEELLPRIADFDAIERLRRILDDFARKAYWRGEEAPSSGFAPLVHPGVSCWADRPELWTLGERSGLSVICPPARVLTFFANPWNLLREGWQLGIPNLLECDHPMHSLREVERFVVEKECRFPFVLRSVKAGSPPGGRLILHRMEDLESRLPLWLEQLRWTVGEVIFLAERHLESSRTVLVPFVRLPDGSATCFPMVESSLRSGGRPVIEFCPAPMPGSAEGGGSAPLPSLLRGWTLALAERCGYVGVGSLTFLVEGEQAYLSDGSARLDAGFHIWEKVAGTQAVLWQLAAHQALPGSGLHARPGTSHDARRTSVLALRIYSEDFLRQLPAPGRIHEIGDRTHWESLTSEAELELEFEAGSEVGIDHSGSLGILWAEGAGWSEALSIAREALEELWIAGSLNTNERMLSELLDHPWIRKGICHSTFLDEEFIPTLEPPAELMGLFPAGPASLPAAPDGVPDSRASVEKWWVGGWRVKPRRDAISWVHPPEFWSPGYERENGVGVSGSLRLANGRILRYCAYPLGTERWQVRLGQWIMRVRPDGHKNSGKPPSARLEALVNGRIHSLLVRSGSLARAHKPLALIESQGTLVPHASPVPIRILRWTVRAGDRVEAGREIAELGS